MSIWQRTHTSEWCALANYTMDSLMRIVPMRSIGGGSWRAHPKRQAIDDFLVVTVESIAAELLELGDVRPGVRNELFELLDMVWPLLHNLKTVRVVALEHRRDWHDRLCKRKSARGVINIRAYER